MKENQNIEWKQSWRDEYLKWICGFANAEGGTLVIGKNDRGEVVGVANAARLLEDIPNKVRDILGIVVAVNLHTEAGLDWLEIVVEAYPSPISYKGEYHLRSGSTKQELRGAALDRFLLRKLGRHWDGVPVPYVAMEDLEPRAIQAFRKLAGKSGRLSTESLAESDAVLVEKLHLTEGRFLKRAATLLFHTDPEKFTTGACVKIGFFRTDSDLLYHDVIEGDLFTQAEKALDLLLTKYLRAGISYQALQRLERFPIPEVALREALINAIVHKDYGSLIPIQISVYDHKLMIWNAGPLPPNWTLASLMAKHSSQPANPDIARVFFLSGLIESWGRGIDLICNTCHAYGCPEPKFSSDGAGFWVEFPFMDVGDLPDTSVKAAVQTPVQMSVQTSVEILRCLNNAPAMTLADVATAIDKSLRTVERVTAKLVKDGKLRRVGPNKGGYWEVLK
ncbi:MAG: ATP-binding protein [Gallionella sp.]|nr:ATP-binding protein [Gallionella sp.]